LTLLFYSHVNMSYATLCELGHNIAAIILERQDAQNFTLENLLFNEQ
jgi:hypothetical protein